MIKRFYYSLVQMKYVWFMFGLPLMIFVLAFMETRKKIANLKIFMMILTIALAIVLVFYYRDKFRVMKQLKKVKDINAYEKGGVVDRSWILEDRMLVCAGNAVREMKTEGIIGMTVEEMKYGKMLMHIKDAEQFTDMTALSKGEAERFAAFLLRKNPDMSLTGIEPKGEGTLKELGAGVQL